MSDDLGAFFGKQQRKKQTKQQKQSKEVEKQKKVRNTIVLIRMQIEKSKAEQKLAPNDQEWYSSGEDEANVDLGVEKKVKDYKEVKAQRQQEEQRKQQSNFTWEELDKQKDEQKTEEKTEEKKKGGLRFTGQRPTFTKSNKVGGNKMEYPELGMNTEVKKQVVQPQKVEAKPEEKKEAKKPTFTNRFKDLSKNVDTHLQMTEEEQRELEEMQKKYGVGKFAQKEEVKQVQEEEDDDDEFDQRAKGDKRSDRRGVRGRGRGGREHAEGDRPRQGNKPRFFNSKEDAKPKKEPEPQPEIKEDPKKPWSKEANLEKAEDYSAANADSWF